MQCYGYYSNSNCTVYLMCTVTLPDYIQVFGVVFPASMLTLPHLNHTSSVPQYITHIAQYNNM